MSGCDCLEGINEKLAEHNTEVVITWYPIVRPLIETAKIDSKKRGKPMLVAASFCPFCGVEYQDQSS